MSERLYALLLRLFPKRFRDAYAEEALHLFRDRARDERGAKRHLRLWFDLLLDLAVSVPRIQFRERRRVAVAAQQLEGVPGFHVLEGTPCGAPREDSGASTPTTERRLDFTPHEAPVSWLSS